MNGRWNSRAGSAIFTSRAGGPSASVRARQNADRFLADLMAGAPAPRRFPVGRTDTERFFEDLLPPPFEGHGEAAEPDVRPLDREPFFGDERGESWRVVARPGARTHWLRDGDLIVRRMPGNHGDPGWQCRLKEDVDVETLRGPDGRLRDDTVVLRRMRRWQRTPVPEAADEASGEIVEDCGCRAGAEAAPSSPHEVTP